MGVAVFNSIETAIQDTGVSSHPITVPPNTVDGDLLVLLVGSEGFQTITTPAGFAIFAQNGDPSTVEKHMWKRASSEPTILTVLTSGNTPSVLAMLLYKNVLQLPSSPVDGGAGQTGVGMTVTAPDLSTTLAKALILRSFGFASTVPTPNFSFLAQRLDAQNASGGQRMLSFEEKVQTIPGAVGAVTVSLAANKANLGGTLAILGAPPPPVAVALLYEGDPASTDLSATAQLLTGQDEIEETVWFQAWSFRNISIEVTGMAAGDVVDVRGASKVTKPDQADPGFLIQKITDNGEYLVSTLPKWIKVRRPTLGASPGLVTAVFFGASRNQ